MKAAKNSKWAKQSSALWNAMRNARGDDTTTTDNYGGQDFGPGALDDANDMVKCKTCGRTFSEKASERHIISCSDRAKNNALRRGPPKKPNFGRRKY